MWYRLRALPLSAGGHSAAGLCMNGGGRCSSAVVRSAHSVAGSGSGGGGGGSRDDGAEDKDKGTSTGGAIHSRDFNAVEDVSAKWFPVDGTMAERTAAGNGLHVVFMEGVTGSGKKDVLYRLKKLNYATVIESYYNTLDLSREAEDDVAVKADARARGKFPTANVRTDRHHYEASLSQAWTDALRGRIEEHHAAYEADASKYRGNVVFVLRSPLTPFIYSNMADTKFREQHLALCRDFNCSTLHCLSDDFQIRQRLAGRHALTRNEQLLAKYKVLGEEDAARQAALKQLYTDVAAASGVNAGDSDKSNAGGGLFDGELHTTSVKQALVGVLSKLGITFQPMVPPSGVRR